MNPILFSGRSNPGLGRKLSAALGLEEGRCLIEDFADGEIRIEVKQAVAGSHVVILQSTAAPAGQNLLELLLLADAIRRRGARTKLNEVEQLADPLLAYLQAVKGVKRVVIAGSYRRRKETVGDLDVLVTCKSDSPVMSRFIEFEDVVEVLSSGKTKSSVRLRGGLQVDLRVVPEVSYGAALYYFTGSKEHNIAVRKIAVGKGLKINEYGVFQGKGDDEERIAGASEEDIFKTVGLRYIEPELREGINYHDHHYYVKNDPQISDSTYDKLFSRLQELEEAFPELRSDSSPTRRVGVEPADALDRVEHSAPMLSLDAALDEKKIREFFDFVQKKSGVDNPDWVAEPKFDGASVEVVYEKDRFKSGSTRGDSRTGENISENLATVRTLPLRLDQKEPPDFLAVRGEVFLPRQAFQELNRQRVENGEEPFANPRNACAGTLRRLESKVVAHWPLDIFFYDILKVEGEEFDRHWDILKTFEHWGLQTNPLNRKVAGFDELAGYRQELIEKRDNLPYEIDGIVVKLDDLGQRDKLGARQRSPRWAMAWKFEPKQEVTILEKIVVQVGTTGILTPVALLQPVDVGGVTVSRATLHNEAEIERKDLREGDKVRIERAGDVIPEVVERIERPNKYAHKFHMPETCPSCGTEVVRCEAYALCPAGLSCRAQLRGRIRHYGSRQALDIAHLGSETAHQLVERAMVKSLADLYRLEPECSSVQAQ